MNRVFHFFLRSFILFILIFNSSNIYANYLPHFIGGHTQSLSVCQSSNPNPINTILRVGDLDVGQTETWSLLSGVFHGTVSASFSTTSTGGTLTPTGLFYTPNTGYSGNDTFTVRVTDGIASDTTIIIVTVIPLPHVGVITGPTSVCVGATITLVDTPAGTWSSMYSIATVSSSGVVTGVVAGIDSIVYTVSNVCGLIQTAHPVTIIVPHAGTITGPNNVCVGATITLIDTTTGGTWSSLHTTASVTSTGILTGLVTGRDTIVYSTSVFCGPAQARYAITVNPAPDYGVISGPDSMCIGTMITLLETSSVGSWSSSNPHDSIFFGVVEGLVAGIDTIFYTASNAFCTMSAMHIITINPYPYAGVIIGVDVVCEGSNITLIDSIMGGTWYSSNTTSSVSSGGIVTGLAGGTDTIVYIYINACGPDTTSKVITINPLPYISPIMGPSELCSELPIVLTDTTGGGSWSSSNTLIAVISSSGLVTGISPGIDTIKYSLSNACGIRTITHVITVYGHPFAGNITGIDSVCVGATITLTDTVSGGLWQLTNAKASIYTNIITGMLAGKDTVYYKVSNICGSDSAMAIIKINPLPNAGAIIGTPSICPKDTLFFYDNSLGGVWSSTNTTVAQIIASGGDSATIASIIPGVDTIVYTVSNNCGIDVAKYSINVNYSSICPNLVRQISKNQEDDLIVYPNPNLGSFIVKLDDKSGLQIMSKFVITDMLGSKLNEWFGNTGLQLNVETKLPVGIYLLTAQNDIGVWQKMIVVER